MFQELKLIFEANARIERYEVSNKFYSCKMEENSSVSEHILKMSGYNNHLIQLGVNLPDDSVIDRILQSLPPSYKSFVMNYYMQGRGRAALMAGYIRSPIYSQDDSLLVYIEIPKASGRLKARYCKPPYGREDL